MEVLVAKEVLVGKEDLVGKVDLVAKVDLAKVEVFDSTALVSSLLFLPPLTREPGSDLLKRQENKMVAVKSYCRAPSPPSVMRSRSRIPEGPTRQVFVSLYLSFQKRAPADRYLFICICSNRGGPHQTDICSFVFEWIIIPTEGPTRQVFVII